MDKAHRELTEDEKEVLKPDIKAFVQDRISDAKEIFNKAEADVKELVNDLTSRPQQTIEESKELIKGYGDWLKSKAESLESTIENVVRQTVKVFSPIQPLQKIVDELEERTEKLTKEVERLIASKENNRITQPPLSQ